MVKKSFWYTFFLKINSKIKRSKIFIKNFACSAFNKICIIYWKKIVDTLSKMFLSYIRFEDELKEKVYSEEGRNYRKCCIFVIKCSFLDLCIDKYGIVFYSNLCWQMRTDNWQIDDWVSIVNYKTKKIHSNK